MNYNERKAREAIRESYFKVLEMSKANPFYHPAKAINNLAKETFKTLLKYMEIK